MVNCGVKRRHATKSPTKLALKLNPVISLNWTDEEDRALKEALSMFASFSGLTLYAKIAKKIGTKKIRDVALRVKWMNEQGAAGLAIKSNIAAQSNSLPYPPEELRIANDDDIYLEAIGGTTGSLLEINKQALDLIKANLASSGTLNLLQDNNINLFGLIKDNVDKVLNDTNIKSMPPLPVSLKDINILPRTNYDMFTPSYQH